MQYRLQEMLRGAHLGGLFKDSLEGGRGRGRSRRILSNIFTKSVGNCNYLAIFLILAKLCTFAKIYEIPRFFAKIRPSILENKGVFLYRWCSPRNWPIFLKYMPQSDWFSNFGKFSLFMRAFFNFKSEFKYVLMHPSWFLEKICKSKLNNLVANFSASG